MLYEQAMTNDERVKELDAMVEEIRRQMKALSEATVWIYQAASYLENCGDHYRIESRQAMEQAQRALEDANPPQDWGLNEEKAWGMVKELDEPAREEVER